MIDLLSHDRSRLLQAKPFHESQNKNVPLAGAQIDSDGLLHDLQQRLVPSIVRKGVFGIGEHIQYFQRCSAMRIPHLIDNKVMCRLEEIGSQVDALTEDTTYMLIKLILRLIERKHSYVWAGVGVLTVGVLGIIDYLTGNEIAFSLFYLLPILLVTLAVNETAGFILAILSAQVLMTAEAAAGHRYSHWIIYVWNVFIRMGLFSFFAFLVASLQEARREEQLAARTDFVTGAVNARCFHEMLQMEIDRIRRYPHPFTVAFIDIDNFKKINDTFGHRVGDSVLRFIADQLKSQLRRTDVVARIGGDEFALLLPSLRQPEAEAVLSKVHTGLRDALHERNMPLTFSVGAVTCVTPPHAAEQLISLADELMYTVKNSTKNDIRYRTVER